MKKNGFLADFKAFVLRGNVLDMAVGVVVGGAFSQIVSSLVADVLMPVLGLATGGSNLAALAITLRPAEGEAEAVLLRYGLFLQNIVDFALIALCVFAAIRLLGSLKRKQETIEETAPAAPQPSGEELLLMEIRDLLRGGGN
jgi:large conductance mechanosensitive channel